MSILLRLNLSYCSKSSPTTNEKNTSRKDGASGVASKVTWPATVRRIQHLNKPWHEQLKPHNQKTRSPPSKTRQPSSARQQQKHWDSHTPSKLPNSKRR